MAISFVAKTTTPAALTGVQPTGSAAGDLIVAVLADWGETPVHTGPAGWTKFGDVTGTHVTGRFTFWYIVRGAGAPALTWSGPDTVDFDVELDLFTYRGTATSGTIIDVTPSLNDNASSGSPASPTITTTIASDWLACVLIPSDGSASVTTKPTGMTSRQETNGSVIFVALADLALGAAGATGTKTWSLAADVSLTFSFAIAPPAGAADASTEWMPLPSDVIRLPRAVDTGIFVVGDPDPAASADASFEWWMQPNEPQRTPQRKPDEGDYENDLSNVGAQEDTFLEWWLQPNEPVRQPPRAVDTGDFEIGTLDTLTEDTFLEWYLLPNQPVQMPQRKPDEGDFKIADLADPPAVADTSTEWIPNTADVIRTPRAVDTGFFVNPDLETLQEDTFLEWWRQTEEPVRTPPRPVDAGLFVLLDLGGTLQTDTGLTWWLQPNEPVRLKLPVGEGFFVVGVADDIVIGVGYGRPIRLGRASLERFARVVEQLPRTAGIERLSRALEQLPRSTGMEKF